MMENQFDGPNGGGSFNNHDFMPVDSWRILRIMSEFVESFEDMSRCRDGWSPCSVRRARR